MELHDAVQRSARLRDVITELEAAERRERDAFLKGGGDGYLKLNHKVAELRKERDSILKRLGVIPKATRSDKGQRRLL